MSEKGPNMPEPTGPEQPPKPPGGEGPSSSNTPEGEGSSLGTARPTSEGRQRGDPGRPAPEPSSEEATARAARRAQIEDFFRQQINENPQNADLPPEEKERFVHINTVFRDPESTPDEILAVARASGWNKEQFRHVLTDTGHTDVDAFMARFDAEHPDTSPPPAPEPVSHPEPEPVSEPIELTDEQKADRDSILPDVQQQLTDSPEVAKDLGMLNDDGTLDADKVKNYAGDLIRLQDPTTPLPELQRVITDWNLNRQEIAKVLFTTRGLASASPDEIKVFVQTLNLDRRVVREAMKNSGHHSDAEIDEALGSMNGLTDDEMKEQTAFDDLPPEAKAEIGDLQGEMDEIQGALASGEDSGDLKERAVGLLARFNNWRKGKESSRHILMNTWTIAFFSALLILIWTIKTGGNAFAGIGKR